MSFYVKPQYLETAHYYYFSIGIFSFMCAIIFGFSAVYSIMFIILYIGQSSFAWYISWIMQRKMRQLVIPSSLRFASEHVAFTFLIGGMTFCLWYFNALNEENLISSILYVNYFVFFAAVVWYLTMRFGVVKTLFDVYDSRMIEKAKKIFIKTRDVRKDIFTRTIASDEAIKKYKSGSDAEIDEMLMGICKEKGGQKLVRKVAEIEMVMCSRTVERLRRQTEEIISKGAITPRERAAIERYNQMIEEYSKISMEYEKNVLVKIPAE